MQDIFFKLILFFFLIQLNSEEISLDISIKNGTTKTLGKAEKLKVIALQGGMIPIKEVENVEGNFRLDKIQVEVNSPILLQAIYKNNSYNKMIPPVPEFRKKTQEINVYENTNSLKDFDIRSLIQLIREQDEILVYKIYLIENKTSPEKSFYSENNPLKFYIPENAEKISAQLVQGNSKMPIPIQLVQLENKAERIMQRGILPGISELQISYSLEAKNLSDISFFDKQFFETEISPKIIFHKPKKMNVEILNAKQSIPIEKEIPDAMGAFRVNYSEKGIQINISGGKPDIKISDEPNQRKLVNGKYFTTWDKSLIGVIGILGILFSLSFAFIFKKNE